jgi:hypothetical protein
MGRFTLALLSVMTLFAAESSTERVVKEVRTSDNLTTIGAIVRL